MHFYPTIDTALIALFLVLVVLAARSDVASYRIPNRINMAIAALYPAYVLAAPQSIDWIGALIVSATMFGLGLALFMLRQMGGGDVKMIAAVSLWAGPLGISNFLVFMALTGGLMAFANLAPVRSGLAFAIERFTGSADHNNHTTKPIPYGVAIAVGGFAAAARIL